MAAANDTTAAFAAGDAGADAQAITVDLTKLTALSPEVISKQATVSASSRWVAIQPLNNQSQATH